jgi:hypothetical protein
MTTLPPEDELQLLDPRQDALTLEAPPLRQRPRRGWWLMLGWSATSAPIALLLVTGVALGPRGINLLTSSALSLLGPVIPVSLGALGVLVGLEVGRRRLSERRVLAAALLESGLTGFIVAIGLVPLASRAWAGAGGPIWMLVAATGICAATSLTLPSAGSLEPPSPSGRIKELGVLLPIVAGALLLAALQQGPVERAVLLLVHATAVTLLLAGAGWLLLTQAASETEERVFAVSALLLVGGVADALSMSALFTGLAAGVFWRFAGDHPRKTITRDVLFLQHPLVVLVLLVAGARADLSWLAAGVGTGYVVLRMLGKLLGGALAWRMLRGAAPRDVGLVLLPPGVFGIAFALNVVDAVGENASFLLAAVVAGTIGADIVALLLSPRRVSS